jgi:alkylation response protein AidB-like acyl-CoA dehydrogenase
MAIPFIPTEEQTMLRDSAKRWSSKHDPREADKFEETWPYIVEMGWLMAGLPEEAGGLGGTAFDTAIVAEELGACLVRAPFVEYGMTTARILLAFAPDRLAALAAGEAKPLFVHDELEARGDPVWVDTKAVGQGGKFALSGRKSGVVGAPFADAFLVSARSPNSALGIFEVAPGDATIRAFISVDDRPSGELLLDGTPATLFAEGAAAEAVIREAFDYGLVGESAEAVGAMQRAMEITRDYLMTRKQYGKLIGEFQALRHRLADMFIEVETARSIVLRGLEALENDPPAERSAIAAAVKARTAQAGLYVGANGVQLHGGYGVTNEYAIGHYYKRLLAFDQRHGGNASQVERFAEMQASRRT